MTDRPTRAQAKVQGLKHYFGTICERHPELAGERKTASGNCLQCVVDYNRHQWRTKKELCQARQAEWRQANPDRNRANWRKFYHRNKDRMDADSRAKYQHNKPRVLATTKAWYDANKERKAATAALWRQANPETVAAINSANRARRRNAPGRFVKADIDRLWDEQCGICAAPHCDTPLVVSCTVDHKQPLSRGGSNWPTNLQLLCKPCNSSKHDKTMDEWLCIVEAA